MPDTFKTDARARISNLWKLIGNTPFIAISYSYKGGTEQQVLVKCEQYNMTGSIKDRMALYILQRAVEQDKIRSGDLIIEATSGNTGIAFAAIGKFLGNPVRIIMPDWMSQERQAILKSYGAELQLVSREEGGFLGSIRIAESFRHYDGIFLPGQFENGYNTEAHERTTAREIGYSLILENIQPAAFVAGVGTGGTIMGVGKFLRTLFPEIRVHPVEPAESPTLSTGHKTGNHRIQGISDEFIPAIIELKSLDKVLQVNDGDAILMAQKISNELGLGVGISSGANLAAAIRLQQELGSDKIVVTIFPDDHKKYVSTDLFREEPAGEGYMSNDLKLTGHRVLKKI